MLKKMSKKWTIVTAVLAVALLTAVFGAGLALADGPEPYGPGPHFGWERGPGLDGGRRGPGLGWGSTGINLFDVAAEALDMTPDQLRDELRAGKSLADILADKGLETKDLAEAFLDAQQKALAEAVEKGDLTQEQADAILVLMEEPLEEHLERMMEGSDMVRGEHGPGMGWGSAGVNMFDVTAEALDMTPGQLWDELRADKSLADILTEKGLETKDLAEAFLDAQQKALAEAVEKGDLTQEQADDILTRMGENIEERLERMMEGYGPGMGWGEHGPGLGWGEHGPGMSGGERGPGMGGGRRGHQRGYQR